MSYSTPTIWLIIVALGIGTMMIRFSFLGLLGGKDMPPWVLRHLRYTPVAVLPGLVMPLLVWPDATGGAVDPLRLLAGFVAFVLGYRTKNVVWGDVGRRRSYGRHRPLGIRGTKSWRALVYLSVRKTQPFTIAKKIRKTAVPITTHLVQVTMPAKVFSCSVVSIDPCSCFSPIGLIRL